MTVEVHIENIFNTPIYISSINVDKIGIKNQLFSSVGNEPNRIAISNDEQVLNDEIYLPLKDQIDQHMRHFYENVLGYDTTSLNLEMSTSWIVKSQPNEESDWHAHSNSIFSGVYYVHAPENCGNISFDLGWKDDRRLISLFEPQIREVNQYNTRSHTIVPKTGMIVLFPSSLRHKVERNCSDKIRVSVAFNYFFRGNFLTRSGKLSI